MEITWRIHGLIELTKHLVNSFSRLQGFALFLQFGSMWKYGSVFHQILLTVG